MKSVACVVLSLLLAGSGCSEHISAHCLQHSRKIASSRDVREDYRPTLTPIADVAGDCYCYVEDAAIVAVMAPAVVVFLGFALLAVAAGPENAGLAIGSLLDELAN